MLLTILFEPANHSSLRRDIISKLFIMATLHDDMWPSLNQPREHHIGLILDLDVVVVFFINLVIDM